MSSRLLTMKFMQRAAASSPVSSPSTPDLPSIKRRKTGDASPGAFEVDALVDQRAVEVALANEEALRQAALDRAGAEAGDTRWILNFKQDEGTATEHSKPSYQIIQTGFAAIDNTKPDYVVRSINNEDQRPVIIGRRSFGKFNRAVEVDILINFICLQMQANFCERNHKIQTQTSLPMIQMMRKKNEA